MSSTAAVKATKPRIYRLPRWRGPVRFVLIVALVAAVYAGWKPFVFRFAPMSRTESQCLVCGRHRDELAVRGVAVHDRITQNERSRWIDSFLGAHEHVWLGSTKYHRQSWFGPMSIGCGGNPNLSTIYRMRGELGEVRAQAIVLEHARFVQSGPPNDLVRVDKFLETLLRDPDELLD